MFRTILAILGIVFAVIIIYFVFFYDGQKRVQATPLNINLEEIKPPEWKAYDEDGLELINIDHDAEPEWLFLYKDGYGTNQIGGVIYDAQNRPRGDFSIPIASQVPTYLVPYKLLPDYPASKNQGYLGDLQVDYKTVGNQLVLTPTATPASTPPPKAASMTGERLLVRGSHYLLNKKDGPAVVNRFSVFWWVGPEYGYSGALAYTPGWFSLSKKKADDWADWKDAPERINRLWAWEPQVDRSNICRVVKWQLDPGDNPPITWHFQALYEESFLRFCTNGIPSEPAFPEGQVLAYLLDGRSSRWKKGTENPPKYADVNVFAISEPEITDQPFQRPIAPVDVDFEAADGFHSMRWVLEMIPPATVKDPVRWRIFRAEDR